MKYFKQLLSDYVYELSTADVVLMTDNKFRFNTYRSRKLLFQKLIDLEGNLLDSIREHEGFDRQKTRRVAGYVENMEQLFSFQEDHQIWHKHLYLTGQDGLPDEPGLLLKWKSLLSTYFAIQYDSLQRLKHLIALEPCLRPGCYKWNARIIALYEMLNALWETMVVTPLGDQISKKAFFNYFFTLFGIQEKTENYHVRISEAINRKNTVLFLSELIGSYKDFLDNRY